MLHSNRIGPKDRERVFELASQGLFRQIAERMAISFPAIKYTLEKGLIRCSKCARVIERGALCPLCGLPSAAPFGERLKAFRTVAGISQMALALLIGVTEGRLRNWVKGQVQPTEHELTLLAKALGITVQELTGEGESPQGN